MKCQWVRQGGQYDREALNALQAGAWDLPEGCEVTYDLEAVDVLQSNSIPEMVVQLWADELAVITINRYLDLKARHRL